jgi:hypothetical protein
MNNGELTARMARVLTQKFMGRAEILFDHGDKKSDGEDHVGVIRSWFGNRITRDTLLADLDMAVVLPNSNRLVALIEIEESSANAKTLLGDVFATLFGDHITFQGKRELHVDAKTTMIVFAQSQSHSEVADHLSRLVNTHGTVNTFNSCIGRIVVGTYKNFAELEDKLITLIEHALGNS